MIIMILLPDDYFQVRNTKIYTPKAKKAFKIVALGDVHLSDLVSDKKLSSIKYQLERESGDYYVFLGDLIDEPEELLKENIRRELKGLIKASASLGKTMVILGSHDFVSEIGQYPSFSYDEDFWAEISSYDNVYLLNGDYYIDDFVYFMGYTQPLDYYYDKNDFSKIDQVAFYKDFVQREYLYRNVPQNVPSVCLIHSPEFVNSSSNLELFRDYDLLVSGHDHDGCVPFGLGNGNRGIISPKKELFPNNVRGVRILGNDVILIISGGIVKIQNCAPKMLHWLNHLCPMQLDTIEFFDDENCFVETQKRFVYSKKR